MGVLRGCFGGFCVGIVCVRVCVSFVCVVFLCFCFVIRFVSFVESFVSFVWICLFVCLFLFCLGFLGGVCFAFECGFFFLEGGAKDGSCSCCILFYFVFNDVFNHMPLKRLASQV